MDFKSLLKKRKSTRKFMLGKSADWRKVVRAIDYARFIPKAGGNYNLKFVIVGDPDIIAQLADAAGQDFVGEASHVVVVVSDEESMVKDHGDRGRRYTAQMAGAAIQNLLLGLTSEGLASCWVGLFYDEMVRSLLNIPDDFVVEGLFPVGSASKVASKKSGREHDLSNLVFFERWGNKEMEKAHRLSEDAA